MKLIHTHNGYIITCMIYILDFFNLSYIKSK